MVRNDEKLISKAYAILELNEELRATDPAKKDAIEKLNLAEKSYLQLHENEGYEISLRWESVCCVQVQPSTKQSFG